MAEKFDMRRDDKGRAHILVKDDGLWMTLACGDMSITRLSKAEPQDRMCKKCMDWAEKLPSIVALHGQAEIDRRNHPVLNASTT